MNEKGFTLVEILSVIVLIGLLMGIGIPGIMRISDNMKERSLTTKISNIKQAAILYGQDNKTTLQSDLNCNTEDGTIPCKKISVYGLIETDYLDSENYNKLEFTNPKDNSSMLNNCVYIYKKNNRVYAYYPNDGTECDPKVTEDTTTTTITTTTKTAVSTEDDENKEELSETIVDITIENGVISNANNTTLNENTNLWKDNYCPDGIGPIDTILTNIGDYTFIEKIETKDKLFEILDKLDVIDSNLVEKVTFETICDDNPSKLIINIYNNIDVYIKYSCEINNGERDTCDIISDPNNRVQCDYQKLLEYNFYEDEAHPYSSTQIQTVNFKDYCVILDKNFEEQYSFDYELTVNNSYLLYSGVE